MFVSYLTDQTAALSDACLSEIQTLDDWNAHKDHYRHQLYEMLGLDPLPPKTDLKATVTGMLDHPDFTVEKLHFQSMPGLYVTANLYVPKRLSTPAPAILYVCGHSLVKTNGVSYGNKTAYQHHGIWFARNGYVCLIIDTVEAGEIEGKHHGTYKEGMWWWNSRGYSSAAAEAWNCIRSLDYLQSRKEVDPERLGVTGRSGGGAYSWWTAALDERIKAACPVAGITDLHNHVVDGTVEGHCDCMFMVNTYRWDYAKVAALVAPRPLLICNSDKDNIFPLEGLERLHAKVRRIYELNNAGDKLGLLITEGPHQDTQDLQLPVFRWFNRWLKKENPIIDMAAVKLFTPQQLKVFDTIPKDEITSKCYENFTKLAEEVSVKPGDPGWVKQRDAWLTGLREKTFGGWPVASDPGKLQFLVGMDNSGGQQEAYNLESEAGVNLRISISRNPTSVKPRRVRVIIDGANPPPAPPETVDVVISPRGTGPTVLANDPKYQVQMRRRMMLLGQTLAGMQVWDVRRAIQAVRSMDGLRVLPLELVAGRDMTEVASFATLFEPGIESLHLVEPPRGDKEAPDFLNWSRVITPNQLSMLAQDRCKVVVGELK